MNPYVNLCCFAKFILELELFQTKVIDNRPHYICQIFKNNIMKVG
jgi:hypothetical protein